MDIYFYNLALHVTLLSFHIPIKESTRIRTMEPQVNIHTVWYTVLAKQLFFSEIKTIYSINTVKQNDLINNVSQKVPIIQSSKRLSGRETEKSRVFVWVFVMRWLNLLLVAKYSRPDDSQTDTLKAKSKRYIYTKTWLLTPPPPPPTAPPLPSPHCQPSTTHTPAPSPHLPDP